VKSFFDKNYQTPVWFKEKNLSRRRFLKSAAGASTITALPSFALSAKELKTLKQLTKTDPWLTLDATLMHLLPASTSASSSGPSAKDIKALAYLHQVMTVQPTEQDEKEFILKGVGWLNGFSQSQKNKAFVALTFDKKESVLRGISKSRAGENWLTTLLAYVFEAMLAPPAYGGNPNGVGWQWLEHKAGFPLPEAGQRYFELPPRARAKNEIAIQEIATAQTNVNQGNNNIARVSSKTSQAVKRTRKA